MHGTCIKTHFSLEFLSEGKMERVQVQMLGGCDWFLAVCLRKQLKTPSVCSPAGVTLLKGSEFFVAAVSHS